MDEIYLLRIKGPPGHTRFIELPSLEDAKISAQLHESYGYDCQVFVVVEEIERS